MDYALKYVRLDQKIEDDTKPVFMKSTTGYEPDRECYDIPDYVEIEIV